MAKPKPTILQSFRSKLHRDLMKVCLPFPNSTYDDLSTLEIIVILLEDRRFFQHRGIDWLSVVREIWKMCTFRKFGGASTIDMQLVRTRTGYKERRLSRKLYEMLLAFLLQTRMRKIAILRTYLGVVYLGSGITGVSPGARKMFRKDIFELNEREAALLAAMMVYPRPLRPTPNWQERVDRRAKYGLHLLQLYGERYRRRIEE
jgi:membrane peptidoglycan carboxypeptidase